MIIANLRPRLAPGLGFAFLRFAFALALLLALGLLWSGFAGRQYPVFVNFPDIGSKNRSRTKSPGCLRQISQVLTFGSDI